MGTPGHMPLFDLDNSILPWEASHAVALPLYTIIRLAIGRLAAIANPDPFDDCHILSSKGSATTVTAAKNMDSKRWREVFSVFLRLGLTSFGGPVAHLGYFRQTLIVRRQWMTEAGYAEVVALCQFLPGPASSQVAFVIGMARAGPWGAAAAWCGFTLPSALLMLALAWGSARVDGPVAQAVFHGLKLVAVVIVAQALWGMARTLTPDIRRSAIAIAAGVIVAAAGSAWGQVGAIAIGSAAGALLCGNLPIPVAHALPIVISRRFATGCLAAFGLLLLGLPLLASSAGSPGVQLFDIFYRSGALVFGGGHVILPLLREALVPAGLMTDARFLAGYGAAQALPGPLFAIAAYLGAEVAGVAGASIALVAISLPGLLIVTGVLPFWLSLRGNAWVRSGVAGANAAVVGILAMALYDPLWTTSVVSWGDVAIIATGLAMLIRWRLPPLLIVVGIVAASVGAVLPG